jgi:large subunit ribosomal protein L31/Ran GTPase-activating protein 1
MLARLHIPAPLCRQTSIESLAFQNDGISTHAAAALLEILPNPASLKRLQLYNNMSGDEGAYAIATIVARAPGMQDFRMSSSRVDRNGGMALAQALAQGAKPHMFHVTNELVGASIGF